MAKLSKIRLFIFVLLFLMFFPAGGQAADPHLVSLYINETLEYSTRPVYLTATALYSDGSTKDVTNSGTWESSRTSIARVHRGKVEFEDRIGEVTITFSYGNMEASVGTEVVDITDLQITTRNLRYSTKPVQLKVRGRYNDGELEEITNHISWYSTNTDVARVDSQGVVTFRDEDGVARIGVIFTSPLTQETLRDEIEVTVTIDDIEDEDEDDDDKAFTVKIDKELDPGKTTNTLKAYKLYSDDSKQTLSNDLVVWSSSNPNVAEVDENGRVTFTGKPGRVTITVSYRNYRESTSATVAHKLTELSINESLNFAPYFLISPPKLTVTGEDNAEQSQLVYGIDWSSSNEDVGTIDSQGQIKFTGESGDVTFTAAKDGLSTSLAVTVPVLEAKTVKSVFINPSLVYSTQPQELKGYALYGDGSVEEITKDCQWVSTNPGIARVENGTVYFSGLAGSVEIICSYQGFSDRDKILVSVPGQSTKLDSIKFADHKLTSLDNNKELTVYGIYSDNSFKPLSNVKYYSLHPNIARIQNHKLVLSGQPGTATIEASAGNFRNTLQVDIIKPAGTNEPLYLHLTGDLDNFQNTKELKAYAIYPEGRQIDVTQDVIWNTTNKNIAQLLDKGRVAMVGNGPVRISAAYENLNTYLSNKAYYQFGNVHPFKTNLVELDKIKSKIQEKLAANSAVPIPQDIYGHWAQKDIELVMKLGWMGGYPDSTFKPDNPMGRGEFASLLARSLLLDTDNRYINYLDTSNHWAKESIAVISNLGIAPIAGNRMFRPDEAITREEIAQMINNLITVRADTYYPFIDVLPAHSSATAIANVAQAHIIAGMDSLHFRPEEKATRAQSLAILLRLLKTDPEMDGILNRASGTN
ncbi:MAG: S-layer homology domain-containing protein [Peptococcaceae bacterium]